YKKLQNIFLMYQMKNLKVLDLKLEFAIYSGSCVMHFCVWFKLVKVFNEIIAWVEKTKQVAFLEEENGSAPKLEILMGELPEEEDNILSDKMIGAQ
ncbi:11039_t:CDS:2, partial [Acaulospora morrowiae]